MGVMLAPETGKSAEKGTGQQLPITIFEGMRRAWFSRIAKTDTVCTDDADRLQPGQQPTQTKTPARLP